MRLCFEMPSLGRIIASIKFFACNGPRRLIASLLALICFVPTLVLAAATPLNDGLNLMASGRLVDGKADEPFPDRQSDLNLAFKSRPTVQRVRLTGGSYWLFGDVQVVSPETAWVFDPNNSLMEHVDARIYGSDGSFQQIRSGYTYPREYMLHYGKDVDLRAGITYKVVVHFTSRYFASQPRFEFVKRGIYQRNVLVDNLLIIGAFGAVAALAIFYFFIYVLTRDKSHLYYASYLTAFFFGWLFPFQILTELWGFNNLHWHYVPIFLLPPFCALFCIDFLRLREESPRLAWMVGVPAAFSLVLLPSCFFALSYAHLLASAIVGIWMPLALVSGIIRWRQGFRPARFYVFAFSAIMVGGVVLLPPNLGLTDELVDNAELVTLLAGTLDAMLLAFALADRIRLLADERRRYVEELNLTLQLARTDALTGIGNRYALDQFLQRQFQYGAAPNDTAQQLLVLFDVDGLKQINDRLGHVKGDELLRTVANGLRNLLGPNTECYRLGGDEFAVIACRRDEPSLHAGIEQIEHAILARELPGSGISYGITYSHECASPSQLLGKADQRMYENKAARKHRLAKQLSRSNHQEVSPITGLSRL